jgi:hypothetical protein
MTDITPFDDHDASESSASPLPDTDDDTIAIDSHDPEASAMLALVERLDPRLRKLILALLALCAILAAGLPTPAHAATREWSGQGNGNWTDSRNWAGNVAPVASDDLIFPGSAASKFTINTFPSSTKFRSILFAGAGYTVGGNRIGLTNGITTTNAQFGNTVSVGVDLSGDQTFSVLEPGGSLTILGSINFDFTPPGGGSPKTAKLTASGAGELQVRELIATATPSDGLIGLQDLEP